MGRGHPHLNGCRSGRPRGAPHLLEKQGYISPLPPTPAPPQDPKAQLCGPDLDDAKAPWQVAVAGSRRATMGL